MARIMILSTALVFRSIRGTLLFLSLVMFCLGSAGGVLAAAAVPLAGETAAETTESRDVTPADVEELIKTLEDPGKREALIVQMKALMAAQRQAEPEKSDGLSDSIFDSLSGTLDGVSNTVSSAMETLHDSPKIWDWVIDQFGNDDNRAWWIETLTKFAIILVVGIAADLVARYLIRRPRAMLERKVAKTYWGRIPIMVVYGALSLAPAAAFAAAGYAVMPWLSLSGVVQKCALIIVGSNVLARLITLTAQIILMPNNPGLRIVSLKTETARSLMAWVRRFVLVMVYFYFINEIAHWLGLPWNLYHFIQRALGLTSCIMAIIVCLQYRRNVTTYIHKRCEKHENSRLRIVEKKLADIWHIPAIIYLVLTYAVWAFQVPDGFEYIASGSLWTIVVVVGMYVMGDVFRRMGKGLTSFGMDWADGVPQVESRVERYMPVLRFVGRLFLMLAALVLIAQAWGIGLLGWLFGTETGRRIPAAMLTIATVMIIATIVWEMVSILIERYLTETDRQGQAIRRSARMRTLLPMVRNALLIVLSIMVGMIVLSELGVNIAPLLAGAGVVGLAIGFGAQSLVKDMITGVFMLLDDAVSVGDTVTLGGHTGTVESLSIRALRLRDYQGSIHTIPFSAVDTVVNMGRDYAYTILDVGVGYREDTDEVTALMKEVGEELRNDPEYAYQIMEPLEILGVDKFMDSSVVIRGRIKTLPLKQWGVGRAYNRLIKKKFDAEGIEMPFPTRTVYFGIDKAGNAPPARLVVETKAEAESEAEETEEKAREEGTRIEREIGDMETRPRPTPEEYPSEVKKEGEEKA